jgi:hypothetical protein
MRTPGEIGHSSTLLLFYRESQLWKIHSKYFVWVSWLYELSLHVALQGHPCTERCISSQHTPRLPEEVSGTEARETSETRMEGGGTRNKSSKKNSTSDNCVYQDQLRTRSIIRICSESRHRHSARAAAGFPIGYTRRPSVPVTADLVTGSPVMADYRHLRHQIPFSGAWKYASGMDH